MISGNVAFKEQTKKVNYADITLRDGTVLQLEPCDFALGKFSMKDETTTGKFGVGHAVGKTMSITLANHTNKFSMYDFFKSIIHIYVSVTLEDGTVLKERKGKYYVLDPASTGEVINLHGVDSMSLFDRPYTAKTVYPATLQAILSDCCLDCGVNIGFKQFDNCNFVVSTRPEECTYRQVVSWVSQIAGYNARISNEDYLELVWYDVKSLSNSVFNGGNLYDLSFADTFDGGDYETYSDSILIDGGYFTDVIPENITRIKSLNVSTDDVIITGVKVKNDDKEVLIGTEDYCLFISGNDFTKGQESEVANYLAQRLVGLQFRPLTCEIPNNPLIEPYDLCYVKDRKGNSYFTLLNSVSYSLNGFTTIQCKADDPARSEKSYTSESAKAIAQVKRDTADKLTTYDKSVQNMNTLSANAMGLYREQRTLADGSVVYYQSNRPITKDGQGLCVFAENSVVYKMTSDGFFVSTNGGKTYTSGFDAQGNAVVNVLSAIGITFDWAKGGTLTLGGDNNISGVLNVLNTNGKLVGKFDKDGLWASNGYFEGDIVSTNAKITGGSINITTDNEDASVINLNYGTHKLQMSPIWLNVGGDYGSSVSSTFISVGDVDGTHSWVSKNTIHTTNGNASVIAKPTELLLYNSSFSISGIGNDFSCLTDASFSEEVTFSGTVNMNGDFITDSYGAFTINRDANFKEDVNIDGEFHSKGKSIICDSTYNDYLGFFGGSGATKQTVSAITLTSSATTSSNASKINEVINALKKYNLL